MIGRNLPSDSVSRLPGRTLSSDSVTRPSPSSASSSLGSSHATTKNGPSPASSPNANVAASNKPTKALPGVKMLRPLLVVIALFLFSMNDNRNTMKLVATGDASSDGRSVYTDKFDAQHAQQPHPIQHHNLNRNLSQDGDNDETNDNNIKKKMEEGHLRQALLQAEKERDEMKQQAQALQDKIRDLDDKVKSNINSQENDNTDNDTKEKEEAKKLAEQNELLKKELAKLSEQLRAQEAAKEQEEKEETKKTNVAESTKADSKKDDNSETTQDDNDELVKEREAWYADLDNSNNNGLKITIQQRMARKDRLGSNAMRPLYLMAYAQCKGYKFCIVEGREGPAKSLGFPACPERLTKFDATPGGSPFREDLNVSGTYSFQSEDAALKKAIAQLDPQCVFSDELRTKWKNMILNAAQHPSLDTNVAQQDFFSKDATHTTIAVNIRRGDFADWQRQVIWDDVYVKLLQELRPAVEQTGKVPEVHIFSEDFGVIDHKRNISLDWSLYEGLVDHFHFAPDLREKKNPHVMDMSLNIRDWRHFVQADILVVGGTFSFVPSYGRPSQPDPKTGVGLTIFPCKRRQECQGTNHAYYHHGWGKNDRYDHMQLYNMPQVFQVDSMTKATGDEKANNSQTKADNGKSESNNEDQGENVLDQVVRMLLPPKQADRYIAKLPGKEFKFYYYDMPDPYNYQTVKQCIADRYPNASNCDWGSSICTEEYVNQVIYSKRRFNRNGDIVMAEVLDKYDGPMKTKDPTEADLFIVPYPSAGNCECRYAKYHCHLNIPFSEVDAIFEALPYYNATTHHKHLFLVSNIHTDMHAYFTHPDHSNRLVTTVGPAKDCQINKRNSQHKFCGQVVIPYVNTNAPNQPPELIKRREALLTADKKKKKVTTEDITRERPYAFAAFMSTKIDGNPWARVAFVENAKEKLENYTLAGLPVHMSGLKGGRTMGKEADIRQAYSESIFVPILRGDEPPQKRLFDAMLSGAIPVVLESTSPEPGYASHFARNTYSSRISYPFHQGVFAKDNDANNTTTELWDDDTLMGIPYNDLMVSVNESCHKEGCMFQVLEDLILNKPDVIRQRQQSIAKVATLFSYGMEYNGLKYPDAIAGMLVQARNYVETYYASAHARNYDGKAKASKKKHRRLRV